MKNINVIYWEGLISIKSIRKIKQIKVQNKVFLARKTAMIEENMLG